MIILLSGRKSETENDIVDILTKYKAEYISDKRIVYGSHFTVVSEYKPAKILAKNGMAVVIDDTTRFSKQELPQNFIGICEDTNLSALELFKKNGISVITCGMSNRNTVTISSINGDYALISVQRELSDLYGNTVYPAEYRIDLKRNYNPFAVMGATAVLLTEGITPKEF